MTQSAQSILFNGNRRLRVIFTGPLAGAAFTSLAYYAVSTPLVSPVNVLAVFAIASNPNAAELAVDSDLQDDAAYMVAFTALPFADSSTLTASITGQSGGRVNLPAPNTEPEANDLDAQTYGIDLLHDGSDFVEDATGDLDTITGRPNWKGAVQRRVGSDGLPWNPGYGPKPGQYVDGPQPLAMSLAGAMVAQAKADDRTAQATVDVVEADASDQGGWYFRLKVQGKDNLDPITVAQPVPTPT